MRSISFVFVNLVVLGAGFSLTPNSYSSTHPSKQVMCSGTKSATAAFDVDVDERTPCSENEGEYSYAQEQTGAAQESSAQESGATQESSATQEPSAQESDAQEYDSATPVLFYPGKLNRMIPQEFYGDFIARLRKHRNVYVADDSSVDDAAFIKELAEKEGICVVSHSTSANDVLELCKSVDDGFVNNVVLIDPIDYLFFKNDFKLARFDFLEMLESAEDFEEKISEFIESNKFDLLRKTLFGNRHAGSRKIKSRVLVLNSRLSRRWKVFPPIPPISKYSVDLKHIRKKVVRQIEEYGHFDILDAPWATMMHNTITRGAVSRETENIDAYHAILVDMINEELSRKDEKLTRKNALA